MPSVADCLRQHAPHYLQRFGDAVPLGHRKVLSAVTQCRTGALGHVLYQCETCNHQHWAGRSCGNRHCPNCGHTKTQRWLEKQADQLLPTHYFLVTFTVPQELRWLVRRHQREVYPMLFDAGRETIRDLAQSSRYLKGCDLGFFGVRHDVATAYLGAGSDGLPSPCAFRRSWWRRESDVGWCGCTWGGFTGWQVDYHQPNLPRAVPFAVNAVEAACGAYW